MIIERSKSEGPAPRADMALAELRQAVEEYDRRFLSPLTGPERQQLAIFLAKLYATTAEGRGEAPPVPSASK
jgi:hypothetical protein